MHCYTRNTARLTPILLPETVNVGRVSTIAMRAIPAMTCTSKMDLWSLQKRRLAFNVDSRRASTRNWSSRCPVDAEGYTHFTSDICPGSSALIIHWYGMCRPPVTRHSPVVHQQGGQEVWTLGARSGHLKTLSYYCCLVSGWIHMVSRIYAVGGQRIDLSASSISHSLHKTTLNPQLSKDISCRTESPAFLEQLQFPIPLHRSSPTFPLSLKSSGMTLWIDLRLLNQQIPLLQTRLVETRS